MFSRPLTFIVYLAAVSLIVSTSLQAQDSNGGPSYPEMPDIGHGLPPLARHIYLGQFDLAFGLERRELDVTEVYKLRAAFLRTSYEEILIARCGTDDVGATDSVTLRFDVVTKQFGQIVDRDKGIPKEMFYRSRFGESFRQSLDVMMNPLHVLTTVGLAYDHVLVEMAQAAEITHERLGCGTREAQQFSENLHAIVLGQQSLQARGDVERIFQPQCRASIGDLAGDVANGCRCLETKLVEFAPVGFLSMLENAFSRDALILSLSVAPDLFEEAKACL